MRMLRAALGAGKRRNVDSKFRHVIQALGVATALWSIYQSLYATIDILSLTIVFLALTLSLTFLSYAPSRNSDAGRLPFLDGFLSVMALAGGVYFSMKVEWMTMRIPMFDPLNGWDMAVSTMMLLMLFECVRRTIGLAMCVIVLLLFGYNLFGNHIPGLLHHNGINYLHYLEIAFFTTDGVFGTPLRVAATYGFLFVIFGTLLHRCGGGDFFYKLAASAGKRPGGPAKIAVISSGLFGSASGNPVADVVTTGSITVPIMKRNGFTSQQAAAIEATASTGGTLMPPVMGAAAFIMAEFTAIPYGHIALVAVIPVALYYLSLYLQVHLQAVRDKTGSDDEPVEKLWSVLKRDYVFLIPIGVLVAVLAQGYSPSMVAFAAIIAIIGVAALRSATRMNPKVIYDELSESTQRVLPVAMACAGAGLVMGGITMTGLANKFAEIISLTSGDNLWLALMTAATLTIVLGMGLPTSASYILASVLISGILIQLGLSVLQAHMFLLYFAAVSAITPPVAIASFAAASLAGTDPMKTAVAGMRRASVVYIMPFAFAQHAPLLLEGSAPEIVIAVFFAIFGVYALSGAFEKYMCGHLRQVERLVLLAAAAFLFLSPPQFQPIGVLLFGVGIARNIMAAIQRSRKGNAGLESSNRT